ncbi:hypothetical protein PQC38_gp003 [Aeromonas phage BUCT695]|nr:hypothetical protein PQC38_gp003 [Aeromonas phage BUCT695]UIW10479.1 hypothetical protein [Aeromonas phage BUCT695]
MQIKHARAEYILKRVGYLLNENQKARIMKGFLVR